MTRKRVDDLFFQFFCERNSDGTKHLRLRGKELFQRFGYRLAAEHIPELAAFLTKNPEIISLDLSYNNIGDEGLKVLAQKYFHKANSVKHLNLLHCDVGPDGLKWLSRAGCLALKSLRLEGNKLGEEGAMHLGNILNSCDQLEDLDIGETDQTKESVEALMMVVEHSELKSLNISRVIPKNFYSRYSTSELADNIRTLLKQNRSLEVFRVQKCEFDGSDIELLVEGLQHHRNLVMLDLGANRFGDLGIKFLGSWLLQRPNLLALRLPANSISETGAQNLSKCLPFSRIRFLDLQYNRIGKRGILELLHSIKKSTRMRVLYLWGNEIDHSVLKIVNHILQAGVLEQECIDIKIYVVDGILHAAYNPTNDYTRNSYCLTDYGVPPELKIVRNRIVEPTEKPRALINFDFIERYPPASKVPVEKVEPAKEMPDSKKKLLKEPENRESSEFRFYV